MNTKTTTISNKIITRIIDGLSIQNVELDEEIIFDFKKIEKIERKYIIFKDCKFKKYVEFTNLIVKDAQLIFFNCEFKDLNIKNITLDYLQISDSKVEIGQLRNLNVITFLDLKLKNVSKFNLINIKAPKGNLKVFDSDNSMFIIEDNNDLTLSFETSSTIEKLILHNILEIELKLSILKTLSINQSKRSSITINNNQVEKSKIEIINVNNIFPTSNIIINNSIIDSFNLISITLDSGFININSTSIKFTHIIKSSINKLQLNNVKFLNTLLISLSNISGLKYSNIRWIPKTYITTRSKSKEFNMMSREEKTKILKDEREIFRQLRYASNSQKNYIDEMEFQKVELLKYRQEMKISKSIPIQDRILLFANTLASDFGLSWIKPLTWLLLLHLLLFALLYLYNINMENCQILNPIAEYLELLNPAHKTPNYIELNGERIIEFIMRLNSAFFIFHFVKATRKYGKI